MDTTKLPNGAVVVAFDGSEHAARGLTWGADVAAREHRTLLIAYAVEDARPYWPGSIALDVIAITKSIREAAEEEVAEAHARVRETHPELDIRTVCETADPRDLLVQLSESAHVLVMGSHGRGTVRALLLGSVASAVTRHAHCPVVVLRPHSETSRGGGVLVGVDGTKLSQPAIEFAFRSAGWLNAPLTVIHCFWDIDWEEDGVLVALDDPEYAEERLLLSESVAGLREKYPDVSVELQLARGLVDRVLIDQAHGRDLLVVGSRTHGALGEALLGSVATSMVEYAPCPVAVVPHERA